MVRGEFPPGFAYGRSIGTRQRLFKNSEVLYNAEGAVRQEVAPNGDTLRYCGDKGEERRMSYHSEARDLYCQYMYIRGEPHEILREMKCAKWRCHFTDHRPGGWRKVRCVHTENGRQVFYEGEPNKEKLVMAIGKKGHFLYYEGERKDERLVRMWCPAGGPHNNKHDHLVFYEGGHKHEYLVRQEWSNGDVTYYEGERGKERKISRVFATGTVQTLEGEAHQEHLVKEVKANGLTIWFMGEKGHERKTREQHPSGTIKLFKGSKGNEYLTTELAFPEQGECSVTQYSIGIGGSEDEPRSRKRRVLLADGSMLLYPGFEEVSADAISANHPRRLITPEGYLLKRTREGHPWKRVQEDQFVGSMGFEQRKRLKTTAGEMWTAMEALADAGSIQENALVAMGDHFKQLNTELDE